MVRCEHDRIKYDCSVCGGSQFCIHQRKHHNCKICGDSKKITINNMYSTSRRNDYINGLFNVEDNIDKYDIERLIDKYTHCHFCKTKLQMMINNGTMMSLKRLNISEGHTMKNCVICCLSCSRKLKNIKKILTI